MLANFLRGTSGQLRRFGVPTVTSAACRLQHAQAAPQPEESDLQEFRETVQDFAQRNIAPWAADIDKLNTFPHSVNLWQEIGDFGLHGEPKAMTHCIYIAGSCSTRDRPGSA